MTQLVSWLHSPSDQLREEAFAALDNLGPAAQLFGLEPAELGPGDGVCAEAPAGPRRPPLRLPHRGARSALRRQPHAAAAGARAAAPPPASDKPGAAVAAAVARAPPAARSEAMPSAPRGRHAPPAAASAAARRRRRRRRSA